MAYCSVSLDMTFGSAVDGSGSSGLPATSCDAFVRSAIALSNSRTVT